MKTISASPPAAVPRVGRGPLVLLYCLLGLGPSFSSDLPAAGTNLRTAHYLLYVETLDPDRTGQFLETAFAEMKKFFHGLEPDRRMQVKIYATREEYQKEMDHLRKIFSVRRKTRDTAGLYLRETACSYLYLQPQEYETRRLLLHEVAHQYHDGLRPWSRAPSLEFCEEGIAEFLALHNWDGQTLQLGVVPIIGPFDYARAAWQQSRNTVRFDLASVVAGNTEVDYPLAWGLVSFLIDRYRPRFEIWRQGINNDVEPRVVWQKQFGALMPEILQSFAPWLQSNVSPWQVVAGEWSPCGPRIEGRAPEEEFGLAILNSTPPALTVTPVSAQSNACGGVVFGFRGARNFHVLQHAPGGPWEMMHYEGNSFPKNERRNYPFHEATPVTITANEDATTLSFDGNTVTVTNVAGAVGLWVKEGRLRFHCSSELSQSRGIRPPENADESVRPRPLP